jgi:ribonucleoside-diphosphate reductase alpha chain
MSTEHNITVMDQIKEKAKTYTHDEAVEASVKYFNGDEMAAKVWVSKYALKDSFGKIYEKTPDDMHRRLAKEIARIERKYPNPMSEDEVYELLKDFRYIVPQGGPMTGIGNQYQIASLSNCFVFCGSFSDGNTSASFGISVTIATERNPVAIIFPKSGVST